MEKKKAQVKLLFIIGCQSSWTNVLESDTENGKSELTEVAETLEKQLSTSAIYGGDLAPILSIVTSTFSRIKAETENDIVSIDDRDDQVRKKHVIGKTKQNSSSNQKKTSIAPTI